MKKIFVLVLCLYGLGLHAQQLEFDKVFKVPGKKKDELYLKARDWLADRFRESDKVIELDDKESGKLYGNGSFRTPLKGGMGLWKESGVKFAIQLMFKDGKYRCIIKNMVHIDFNLKSYPSEGGSLEREKPSCGWMGINRKHWKIIKQMAEVEAQKVLIDLGNYMLDEQDNDW